MVDILIKNSRKEQSDFQIISNETKYLGLLELIDDRIKITLMLGLSQFKWCAFYSIEQLFKLSGMFMVCNTIEKSFEYFKEILKSNTFEVKRDGQQIILAFTQTHFNVQVNFDIVLIQEEISALDAMSDINHSILDIYKEIEELKINLKNKDQKMKEQDQVINSQKNELEELKNNIKQIQEENQKQMIEYQQYILSTQFMNNVKSLGQWIHEGKQKMELKLVYRATTDGFEISKFYEKCAKITPTLIVIESNNNKRFGGYTDLLWTINSSWVASNPNKSFLFSLDLDKKYTTNQPNCPHAIYAHSNNYAFGGNHDLTICNNSNTTNSSYVSSGHSYGKNEGISKYDLNGGVGSFLTREIEVYQVLFN